MNILYMCQLIQILIHVYTHTHMLGISLRGSLVKENCQKKMVKTKSN